MREIKFRAWDETNKKMMQVESLIIPKGLNEHGLQELAVSDKFNSTYFHYLIAPPLMQYTGLKDKNGKEIYEGDIVKYNHAVEISEKYPTWIGMVEYNISEYKSQFWVRVPSKAHINDDSFFRHNMEVIGNIHENPELLSDSNPQ